MQGAKDYYPFGMVMPGRKFSSATNYRYGFNGKEEDDEVKGDGNQIAYEERIYDSRLGRFLSMDPLVQDFPSFSPYSAFNNSPIYFYDPNGGYSKGDKTTSKNEFLKVLKMWDIEVGKYYKKKSGVTPETLPITAKLNLLDRDYRAPSQTIKTIGEGKEQISDFSYNKHLGKYVDLGGFPLDAVHFFKTSSLAACTLGPLLSGKVEEKKKVKANQRTREVFRALLLLKICLQIILGFTLA